ncbi:MAG: hypothetical protein ACLU1X_01105 [Peptoniphilus grossensis]
MKIIGEKVVNDSKALEKNFDVPQVPDFERKVLKVISKFLTSLVEEA